MSDGDQKVEVTTYTVPEEIKKEVSVAILTGEALNRGVGKLIVDEVTERLSEDPQEALGALVRGEIALTSGAIGESIEQNVQGIEEGEDIEQIRDEVTQFANGLVVLRRMSPEKRAQAIQAIINENSTELESVFGNEWGQNGDYLAGKAFIDRSVRDLSKNKFVIALADSQGKSSEEMAKEIVIANFSEGYVLQKIETSLTGALAEDVDYSELRRLEGEKKRLSREIKDYENRVNQLKQEIQEAHEVARERGGSLLTEDRKINRGWIEGEVQALEGKIDELQEQLQEKQKTVVAGEGRGQAQQDRSTIKDDIKKIEDDIKKFQRQRDLLLNFEDNVEELARLQSKEMVGDIRKKEERLQKVEGELKDKREQVKRERKEYIERVYRSSVKGLGEYAQEVNDAIAGVNLSEEEKVIRRSILDKVREELKDKGKRKEILDILFDLNEPFEDRMRTIFEHLRVNEVNLPTDVIKELYEEMMRNEEFKKSLYHDVATEALAYAVLRDPKALRGRLSREEAAALAFSDGVLLELINSAQQRVEKAQEKLRELEKKGLIKKGFGERVGETLKALGKGIKERKFLTASAITGIILVLILLGILPPLAAWPGIASSAAEGLGEKIIGY